MDFGNVLASASLAFRANNADIVIDGEKAATHRCGKVSRFRVKFFGDRNRCKFSLHNLDSKP